LAYTFASNSENEDIESEEQFALQMTPRKLSTLKSLALRYTKLTCSNKEATMMLYLVCLPTHDALAE
jgi:hypothetical protein